MAETTGEAQVVVCGGGIVGCATAYFLALKGVKPVVVERNEVACAASGHAGGFLARGWGSGPTEALHHQGFDLHARLAKDLGLKSFRRLPTLSVGNHKRTKGGEQKDFHWVDKAGSELMDSDTAHVNPAEITKRLMDAAIELGASLKIGAIDGVKRSDDRITGLSIGGEVLPCSHVVFAMGPWSVLLERWLPGMKVPMEGILSTSLLFRMPAAVEPPCALFCDEDKFGCHLEVNPRNDNTVYVCGCGGSRYLVNDEIASLPPEDVRPDPARATAATRSLLTKTSVTGEAEPESYACIRPCPPDGRPMMGKILENGYLACGHNCWGILWGPITGQIMAEIVTGGSSSVPLAAFDPERFVPRATKRGRHMQSAPVGEQW